MTFGDTIRQARMREKITLRKFAEMVGVSPTYISQVERDEHAPPSIERIEKIAQILKLDIDEMIALAKRTPTSLGDALNKHPKQVADFLRLAPKLTKEQMDKLLIKGNDFLKDDES